MTTCTVKTLGAKTIISRHLYGHFAEHLGRCIYDGIWVGDDSTIPNVRGLRSDILQALRDIRVPNVRWPGGCFADTYHWRDGIGPREHRPGVVNLNWGDVIENNHFGTHEFMDFCEILGCEPYMCANLGSGTPAEMGGWLEYMTTPAGSALAELRRSNGRQAAWDVRYWGVGNESYGCGGNMTAEQYAGEYRRFQTWCRNYLSGRLYRVACGSDDAWNDTVVRSAARFMDGLSIHHYAFTKSWSEKGPATGFPVGEWFAVLRNALAMEDRISRTEEILDRHDPQKRIGIIVDEWGAWHEPEPGTNPLFLSQQNTVRDALVAGVTLNILNNHADRVRMANLAQLVNVLQAPILTDGARMIRTPTYHVFEMYSVHHDATLLPTSVEGDRYALEDDAIRRLTASASRDVTGKFHLSLCNLHHEEVLQVSIRLEGATASHVTGRVLTGPAMDAHNDFEKPGAVRPERFTEVEIRREVPVVQLPPRSVVVMEIT
jgi:alpha-N-arabinofuranosidase